MLQKNCWPRLAITHLIHRVHCRTLFSLLSLLFICTLFVTLCCFPQTTFAHTTLTSQDGPALQVSIGFDSRFRDGNWIPVQAALSNNGPDFSGTLSINIPSQYSGSATPDIASTYQVPVNLPNGAQKRISLYVPITLNVQGITQNIAVDLLDSNGQRVTTQNGALRALNANDVFVGVLSDQTTGFGPLNAVTLPNQNAASLITEQLNASTMPNTPAVLRNFDVLVLDNFTTSSLSAEQLNALQQWVSQGGTLIAVGGPEWKRTLSPLPANFLPVIITGTDSVREGTPLLPRGGPEKSGPDQKAGSDSIQSPVVVSNAKETGGTPILVAENTSPQTGIPLLVQAEYGQGTISYLAFDPTLQPVVGWSGASTLWKSLLLRVLGEQLVTPAQNSGQGVPLSTKAPLYNGNTVNAMLQSLLPNTFPSIWLILVLLLGYVLVLGPIRLLIVRRLKRRDWSWRIVLAAIVIFSLLSYGFALQQKGTSIVSDSVTVIQFGGNSGTAQTSSTAHVTTYTGVFVPNQGDFNVHIPGDSLTQPAEGQPGGGSSSTLHATVKPDQKGTDVILRGVDIWTLRSVISERYSQQQGDISSHLTVQNGSLNGTITNALPYSLSDVYVLVGNQYISIGHLATGQTRQVHLTLISPNLSGSFTSIADQIAIDNQLPSQYGPYTSGSQPQNEFQQRVAILTSLSNSSGNTYCTSNGICYQVVRSGASRTVYYTSANTRALSKAARLSAGPPPSVREHDPLTLVGAPATLIGWADRSPQENNRTTINGNLSTGRQETLIQAPLAFSYAGALTIPSTLITSHLVDVQSTDLQLIAPNIYQMNKGYITFEGILPSIPRAHINTLTVGQLSNLTQVVVQPGGGTAQVDASHLKVLAYNWQTHNWDTFSFDQQDNLQMKNAQTYVSSSGRILIQFAADGTQGTILFSKPFLQVQGAIP